MASSSGSSSSKDKGKLTGKEARDYIPREFKTFTVTKDYSDHKYCHIHPQLSEKTSVRITYEQNLLRDKLPQRSIYVCVYEGRMDLLRALIIGDQGTPYHDNLFIFDFKFPDDYPDRPPKVRYHTFGKSLSPNLVEGGIVCLSLLDTLDGINTSRWVPEKTTMLEILVSIKSHILNDKPYCNEIGRESETNRDYIMAYNEEVFYSSCECMVALLNRPPKNFKRFISDHFFRRKRWILDALQAYIDGKAEVGWYRPDHAATSNSAPPRTHLTLCLVGSNGNALYKKLETAFNRNDAALRISMEMKRGYMSSPSSQLGGTTVVVSEEGDEARRCCGCCDVLHGTWNGISQFRWSFFRINQEPAH